MLYDLIMLTAAFVFFVLPLFIVVGMIYFLVYRKTPNYKNRKRFSDSHFTKYTFKKWGLVYGILIGLVVIFGGLGMSPLPQILGEGMFWFLWAVSFAGVIVFMTLSVVNSDKRKVQKCTLRIEAELIDILYQKHNVVHTKNNPTPIRFTYFCKFRYNYKGKEYVKVEEFYDIWSQSDIGKGYIYINPNNPKQINVDRRIFLGAKYKNEEHDLYNNI